MNLFFACSIQRSLRTVVPNETQVALESQTLLDFSVDYLRSSLADHMEFHDVDDPSDLLARVEGRLTVSRLDLRRLIAGVFVCAQVDGAILSRFRGATLAASMGDVRAQGMNVLAFVLDGVEPSNSTQSAASASA
jgi:hypothetical protein